MATNIILAGNLNKKCKKLKSTKPENLLDYSIAEFMHAPSGSLITVEIVKKVVKLNI